MFQYCFLRLVPDREGVIPEWPVWEKEKNTDREGGRVAIKCKDA